MSAGERRSAVRTGVVWAALRQVLADPGAFSGDRARIVDIGGGTGGFAVPLAELGHRVLVVDPSPDALAALGRRASEQAVTDLVTGVQGDLGDLPDLADRFSWEDADLVLCHGVLEVVPDPGPALDTLTQVLRPGGTLSLLVAQRHAAVIARAMAGHFQQARALLDGEHGPGGDHGPGGRPGRRFTHDELSTLVAAAGLEVRTVHAVRVFADLVPGSLLDLEPGAAHALADLEQAVAERPEYLPLATQLHLIARRG
jgi:SAM-dependent methyltransferase